MKQTLPNFTKVFSYVKKSTLLVILLALFSGVTQAQTTTNGGSGLATNYPDLATAIAALNVATITSPIIITLTGNETAPAGGYAITATGDVTNTISIKGVTSTITASAAHTAGLLTDSLFKIIGGDYITIEGFTLTENAGNTVTTAASNTMTEFGIAVLYASTSNGCNNITLKGNTIDLTRTYQNTFGIYANSTHGAVTPTTATTAIAGGGNNNLTIIGNTITDVNNGILVIGATTAPEYNDNLVIGGSAGNSNTISNYGSTGTFSGYTNVSGSIYGVLVRNTKNFNVSYNNISNTGLNAAGTIRGIFVPAFTIAPIGTFANSINNNTLSVKTGLLAGGIGGLDVAATTSSTTSSLSISNNDFNNFGHTIAASSGAVVFINCSSTPQTTTIVNNTFTNLSLSTTGGATFISNTATMPTATSSRTVSDNRIVGAFTKTGAGGSVTVYNSGDSSATGTTVTVNNNNFSNITLTGATAFNGWFNNDGLSQTNCPVKTISNNIFNNITLGTSPFTGINVGWSANGTQVFNNTVSNVTSAGIITAGINLSSSNNALNAYNNLVSSIVTTGLSNTGVTIGSGTVTLNRNKIVNLESNNVSGTVFGLSITNGFATFNYLISNNYLGDFRTPITTLTTDAIRGINITSSTLNTSNNIYNNTIYLAATSSGANFSTSGVFHTTNATATTAALDLRNNIIVNNSISMGTGNTVVLRRSSIDLTNYASTSNKNDLFGTNIFADGTNLDATLGAYQTRVGTRDIGSISVAPAFLSIISSNPAYLHVDTTVPSFIESGATPISSVTNDYDGDIRQGVALYSGTGFAPDMGADEFEGIASTPACSGTPAAANSVSSNASVCSGASFNLSLSTAYNFTGISYQWKSSPDGATYTNISAATSATLSTSQTVSSYYQCVITCANGGLSITSIPIQVTLNALINCFCPAAVSSTADTDIGNVTIGSLNNGTSTPIVSNPAAVNAYTSFTNLPATNIVQGQPTTFSLSQITNGPTFYAAYANVFIDYNGNGVFDLPAERALSVGSTVVTPLNNLLTGSITVPISSVTGNVLMRVILLEGGSNTTPACNPLQAAGNSFGEVEDYRLNITPCVAPTISVQPTATTSICSGTNLALSVTAAGSGLTYQWKKAGVDISSATNASYNITSVAVSDSGTYTVLITGACGSLLSDVATVTVTATSSSPTEVVSSCDSYIWSANGTTYTASGTYTSVSNCVTRTLNLTITPSSSSPTEVVSSCDSYIWSANGTTYTASGTYTSISNCVTRTLNLTITPSSSSPIEVFSSCDSYTWNANGTTYTASGTYTSVSNCVTRTLNLTITPSSSSPTEVVSSCDNYIWSANGTTYTASGTYTSVSNCVTRTLNLTITPSSSSPTEVVSSCDSYIWSANGTTYTASGTYTSVSNCVTRTLNLTITPSSSSPTEVFSSCDSYTWNANGTTYTASGTYTSVSNCVTRTLNLSITPSSSSPTEVVSSCNSYTWNANGTNYTASGTYTSVSNCVTRTLNLTITPSSSSPTEVVSSCNSYTWNANGTNYTASGTYTSVSNCLTRTLNLTINIATTPTGSSTQTINGTTTTTVSQLVASPSSGATLVWYASSADASTGTNPLSGSTVLVDGATYYGVSENGICRSTPLAVTVTVVLGAESFDVTKFNFYPNPVLDVLNLNYSQELSGVKIFNMIGQELINKSFNADKIQVDMSGVPAGNYFIEVRSLETTKMIKVIKK